MCILLRIQSISIIFGLKGRNTICAKTSSIGWPSRTLKSEIIITIRSFQVFTILWRNFNFVLKTYFRRQNLSFSLNCLHVGVDRGSGWLNSSDDKSSRNLSGYFDLYSDILGSLNVKLYLSEFESTGIVTELDVEVSLL